MRCSDWLGARDSRACRRRWRSGPVARIISVRGGDAALEGQPVAIRAGGPWGGIAVAHFVDEHIGHVARERCRGLFQFHISAGVVEFATVRAKNLYAGSNAILCPEGCESSSVGGIEIRHQRI